VAVSASNQTVTLDTTDAAVGNNFQVEYLNVLAGFALRGLSRCALYAKQPGMTNTGASAGGRTDQKPRDA